MYLPPQKDLNKAIVQEHYKVPTLDEISHWESGATCFSKLDAKDGFWTIHLDEKSSYLTTFNSHHGRYRFLHMPFSLRGAWRSLTDTCHSLWRWQPQITFYGAVFTTKGMWPDPSKIQVLQDLPTTSSPVKLQSFLGVINYLQPFTPGLSEKTMFLCEQLTEWNWNPLMGHSLPVPQGLDLPYSPKFHPHILWLLKPSHSVNIVLLSMA